MENNEVVKEENLSVQDNEQNKLKTKGKGLIIPIIILTVLNSITTFAYWALYIDAHNTQNLDNLGLAIAAIFIVIIYIIPLGISAVLSIPQIILSSVLLGVNAKRRHNIGVGIAFLIISLLFLVAAIVGFTSIPYMFQTANA